MAGVKKFDMDGARQAALGVFWEQGYKQTSLDDLTAAMGISRSSFYNSFQSKHHLFLEVLSLYQSIVVTELSKELQAGDSAKATLRRITHKVLGVTGATSPGDRRGCLLGNTALELGQSDPDASERTRAGLEALQGIFERVLKAAGRGGDFKGSMDPVQSASFLTANLQGALVLAKSGAPPESVENVLEMALNALF